MHILYKLVLTPCMSTKPPSSIQTQTEPLNTTPPSAQTLASAETPHKTVLDEMKNLDFETAMIVAGYAGCATRDRLGNIHNDVWTQFRDQDPLGGLVEPGDVRKLLLAQINNQLEAKKDLLNELETNDLVCNWVLKYTTAWEQAYKSRVNKKYDVGGKIQSAMHEAVHEVWPILEISQFPPEDIYNALERAKARSNGLPLLKGEAALVRFLFRNEYTRHYMSRIAGKILQKREVCNKAGAYSAKQQRHDITQEKDDAVKAFLYAIDTGDERFTACAEMLERAEVDRYFADHNSH